VTAPSPHAPRSGRLSRVTLVGAHRRLDLVLPSDESIGVLLPEIVAMVGYPAAGDARGYQLSTVDARVLDPATTLGAADVPDGAVLRVDPLVDAPPAAIVYDVSDEVADDLGRRRGRWGPAARAWTATAVSAAAVAFAAVLATPRLAPAAVVSGGVVLALAGLAVGLLGRRPVGVAMLLSGAAAAMSALPGWTAHWPLRSAGWALAVGLLLVALGAITDNRRAGLFGGTAVLLLLSGWAGLHLAALPAAQVAAVMAVVSIGALGLLPRIAMVVSGLTRLDDLRSSDESVRRASVAAAVDAAHRGLAVAGLAVTASAALAGVVLARVASGWTVVLAVLVAVALLLRARAFPLAAEVLALVAAGLTVGAQLLLTWSRLNAGQWWQPVAASVVVAAAALLTLAYRPPLHVQARLRRDADRLEGLTVVALIPVAVGVFAVYPRLLDSFR
jgi:ESX secretion system protein EccD